MKVKVSTINLCIFVVAIVIQVFTINYESAGIVSYLKYIVCLLGIVISLIIMSRSRKFALMKNETKRLISVPIFWVIITFIKGINTNTFSQRTIIEFLLMAIPIIYSYCIINTMSAKQIDSAMMMTLFISFIGYLYNLGLSPTMILKNLLISNFSQSTSALESSQFAGVSIATCLYYLYYRKNKIGVILSFIFVVFTFKRLAILTAIILLLLPKVIDVSKPIKTKSFWTVVVAVFLCSLLYFYIMIPQNGVVIQKILGINLDQFTMGRFWRFSLLYKNPNYINYGLGSTYTFLMKTRGFALEMDMCRLIMEVTILGVAMFIYQFFYVVKKNRYCTILIIYLFANMITSHCLASMFSWLIIYMTIGTIEYLDKDCGVKIIYRKRKGNK